MTTPQQDLLFKASFLQGDRGLAAWQAWQAWVDLDDFLDPGSYRLLPQLYRNLKKHRVDDPLMLKLKGVTRLHWFKNQIILHHLEEIMGLLRQAGIRPIILGRVGLVLSGQIDTPLNPVYYDLLVRREEAIATIGCLQKNGFWPVDGWQVPSEVKEYERKGNCLFHDIQDSRVHLFWGSFGQQVGFEYREKGVWERARIIEWNGNTYQVLGLEEQIIYLAFQNIAHDGSAPFLQVIDFMLVWNIHTEMPDGMILRNFANKLSLLLPLQHTLGYIRYTLGEDWLSGGLESILKWPCSAKEQLGYQLNICWVISWEDFPSEWWRYLRENSMEPRLKKVAGFVKIMRRNWQGKYIWQVPVLGIGWLGRKVLYGAD